MTKLKIALIFFILTLIVYYFTSGGNTPYDYFTRLATAFLHGKYYLSEKPSWLTELIPGSNNRFFVVYPPMPAILSMPFVAFFKEKFQQQYLAHILGAGTVFITTLLAYKIKPKFSFVAWIGLLAAFGNITWYLSATGSSWYLGQVSGVFFLALALFTAINSKRAFWTGVFLGASYLSRVDIILAAPFLYFIISPKIDFKLGLKFALGILPFIIFEALYSYLRYRVPWEQGYFILPVLLNETKAAWFHRGVMNPIYISENLKVAFLSFPKFYRQYPFIKPSWAGLAIWITTPAFIFSLLAPLKEKVVILSWGAVLSIFLFVAMHGATGFAQFGYRFAADFYPFLIFLTAKGVARTGLKPIHWILLISSIAVNLWGVLWINKFGWVEF